MGTRYERTSHRPTADGPWPRFPKPSWCKARRIETSLALAVRESLPVPLVTIDMAAEVIAVNRLRDLAENYLRRLAQTWFLLDLFSGLGLTGRMLVSRK